MPSTRYVRLERGIHIDTISGSYRARTTDAAGASVYGVAKDLDTARAWLSNARAARKAGLAPPASPLQEARAAKNPRPTAKTLRSFWLDWYGQKLRAAEIGIHQARGRRREVLRPGTLDGYALLMRCHLLPALGDCTLEPPRDGGITKSAVAAMRDDLARKGLAERTQNEILVLLRRLLDEAAEEGYSVVNVARSVNPIVSANPLKRPQTELRPLSSEERLLLTSALPLPVQAAGYLSSWAALRAGEALGVQVGDLDLWTETHGHVGWVRLQRQRRHVGKRGGGDMVVPWLKHRSEGDGRAIPLAPSLVEYLRWYVAEFLPADHQPDDFLVRASGRGKAAQDQRASPPLGCQSWTYAMAQATDSTPTLQYETLGFDVTAHNLREDCLSEMKDLVSVYARASYAGHKKIEHARGTRESGTTDNPTTYSKHFESDLVGVAHALETLIQRATGGLGLIPKTDERRTAAEVAADLGVSVSLINKLATAGALPFELVRNGPKSSRRLFSLATDGLVREHLETAELLDASGWSVKEAARLLGLHHQTLRREIVAGRVPSAYKVPANYPSGFVWRLPHQAVEELVSLRLRGASTPPDAELWPRTDVA